MTPLQMAYQLIAAIVRRRRDAQYHWANELVMDAIANGAKGPVAQTEQPCRECGQPPHCWATDNHYYQPARPTAEAQNTELEWIA